jgi:hypothetical protein
MNTKPSNNPKQQQEYQTAATKLLTKRRELYDAYERFEEEKGKFVDKEAKYGA